MAYAFYDLCKMFVIAVFKTPFSWIVFFLLAGCLAKQLKKKSY